MQPPSLLGKEAFVTGHNGTSAGNVLLLLLPLPLSICTSQWWGSTQGHQPKDYLRQLWQLPEQFVLIVIPHVLAVMSDISPGVPLAMAVMSLLIIWLLHRRIAPRQASVPLSCSVQLHRYATLTAILLTKPQAWPPRLKLGSCTEAPCPAHTKQCSALSDCCRSPIDLHLVRTAVP